jgi:hypothetical protein
VLSYTTDTAELEEEKYYENGGNEDSRKSE